MKTRTMLVLLLLLSLITGCSSGPDYKIDVTKELYYQKDTALPFEIKVTDNKKAVKGLEVSAQLSMTNMDHGSYDVTFAEGKNGTYSGKVNLPMGGKYEAAFTLEKDGKTSEKVIDITVTKPKGVAKINGEWVTNEDVAFYQFINQLQLEINREAAKKKYTGKQLEEELTYLESQEKVNNNKNQVLTQIIRLRSMAMLANEKGHQATAAEVDAALGKAREQYNQYDSAKRLITEYGKEKFWTTEKQQYEMIVLAQKVQKDLIAKVKKENPTFGEQEVYFQAQKQYEELLVSQVNSLKIEIL
ncbi:transcriptional regulator of met regulon [Bacillus sp. SLBN-46]|uniref:FixH family protein n=1 Tax=Bacillus sp. SLBN-46 TaxID=3042283 RepID=UPI00285E0D0B|nr:FixH family protein [Bacillus sp. SLBN-46]MDR6120907.1 transcriptional regulator of met regulon [Bacillus sp. SLBN-46]